jgi:hypothetical protein
MEEALIKVPVVSSGLVDGPLIWMPKGGPGIAPSIFGRTPACRHNKWCVAAHCTFNNYQNGPPDKGYKILNDADLVLEEYESEMMRGPEGFAQFKQLLTERNLVELLPGMIPGFALRNRKWGQ